MGPSASTIRVGHTVRGTVLTAVTVMVAGLMVAGLVGAPVAVADGPTTVSATQAQADADATAARVRLLTADYDRRSQGVARAAQQLAAAFTISRDSAADSAAAQGDLRRERTLKIARVRALYVDGAAGLALTVLTADSADEAFWRLATMGQVRLTMLHSADQQLDASARQVDVAVARATAADAANTHLAEALGELQNEAAAADRVLAQATTQLAALSATARRLAVAEQAAGVLAAARVRAAATTLPSVGPVTALGIPADFLDAYQRAAQTCPGMSWSLLAAVGQIESGHGRNDGPSTAGAIGPMQFMPATFARYAVDGNGDGRTDAWDLSDAIFSAARYLCTSGVATGGPDGVQRALLAYNHAQWYVDLVLAAQRSIVAGSSTVSADSGGPSRAGSAVVVVPSRGGL